MHTVQHGSSNDGSDGITKPSEKKEQRDRAFLKEWNLDELSRPDRLWLLAGEYAGRKRVPQRILQKHPNVRWARRFHKPWLTSRHSPRALKRLKKAQPDFVAAVSIYECADDSRLIEALIFADMPADKIARHVETDPEVISTFEKLFFDVRPLLKYDVFVVATFLQPESGRLPINSGWLWKLLAFHGGAELLLNFLDPNGQFTPQDWGMLRRIIRNKMMFNELESATSVKPDQKNAVALQRFFAQQEKQLRGANASVVDVAKQEAAIQRGLLSVGQTLCEWGADEFILDSPSETDDS